MSVLWFIFVFEVRKSCPFALSHYWRDSERFVCFMSLYLYLKQQNFGANSLLHLNDGKPHIRTNCSGLVARFSFSSFLVHPRMLI